MNAALWIVAIIWAVMFAVAGVMKAARPREELQARLPWVASFSTPTVRFIGAMEFLGAVGLVVPAATGVAPILTPLAATGLAVLMVGAMVTHIRRKDGPGPLAINAVLFAGAVFVAWGRFGPYAF